MSNISEIAEQDLSIVPDAWVDKIGLNGHHISSYNNFVSHGIQQIITKLYKISLTIQNERDKTPEDATVETINCEVIFTDANVGKPSTRDYYTGESKDLMPNQARRGRLNYSSPCYIDAKITATAFIKGGTTKVRTAEIKNFRLANIPTMVGAMNCHTYKMSPTTKIIKQEDPRDKGGYFIIKGNEWVVSSLESRLLNSPHIFRNFGHEKEITRTEFISKPGDAFENSSSILMRYMQNGNIYIMFESIDYLKTVDLPFYIVFRLLGMISDQEICDNIIYGYSSVGSQDIVSDHMFEVVQKALRCSDTDWGKAYEITDQNVLLNLVAQKTSTFKAVSENQNAKPDEKTIKFLILNLINMMDLKVLPHIGTTAETRHEKLRYLGYLIHKMLLVEYKVVNSTDRDNQKNKRIFTAGIGLAKAFKRDVNISCVQPVKKKLRKEFKSTSFSDVNLADVVKSAIDAIALEKALVQAIVTGDKDMVIKNKTVVNRLASEMLHRKNQLNFISTLRTIRTASTSSSKQDQRADEMRRVHGSFTGCICPIQSADTGDSVGMVKQMALGCGISEASSSVMLREYLLKDKDITSIKQIFPQEIYDYDLAKVFVNGYWVGCTQSAAKLWWKYRDVRKGIFWNDFSDTPEKIRKSIPEIDPFTSIHWDTSANELHFWVDTGRMIHPVLVVRNNGELDPAGRAMIGSSYDPWEKIPGGGFKQDLVITNAMISKLYKKQMNIDDLYETGSIDFVSPEEMENLYVASSLSELKSEANNPLKQFTHCIIPPALFGIPALTCPFLECDQPTRIVYQTNQTKQTCGVYALNWAHRVDKTAFIQYYTELPAIKTIANKYVYPNGMNSIVAVASYGGGNQEDSLIYNISSAQRGYAKGQHHGYQQVELDKNEKIGTADPLYTIDEKTKSSYENLVKGVPRKSSLISNTDVIIAKYMELEKPISVKTKDGTITKKFKDTSVVYSNKEDAVIEEVIQGRDQDSNEYARVKYSSVRELNIGNKFSSRHGQKGVTGMGYYQEDMPFCSNGIVPDLIMNPHAFPSRMTIGQLQEGLSGKLALIKACIGDATIGQHPDAQAMGDELEALGFDRYSNERMFDGKTGEWIDTEIFIAPVYYQRLQKFVVESVYAISTGPTCAITHQPLEGKSRFGGLRIGEMEKDVLISHGCSHFLMEKFRDDSDGFDIYVCKTCGTRPAVNEARELIICKICEANGQEPVVVKTKCTYATRCFFDEMEGMNIGLKFGVEDYAYEKK